MPRAATIQASVDGTLWALDRQTFRRIVLRNAFQKRKMYEALIENVPLLSALSVSFQDYFDTLIQNSKKMSINFPLLTMRVFLPIIEKVVKFVICLHFTI